MKKFLLQIFHVTRFQIWSIVILISFLNPSFTVSAETIGSSLNPIQIENELPGTADWQLAHPDTYDDKTFHYSVIEGYAWTTSTETGEVKFSVSTTAPFFTADVYRLGWYQGKGGKLMQSIPNIQGHAYSMPVPDTQTGLVEAKWPVSFTLVPGTRWVSGIYLVKLTASTGPQSYIPFVLRSSRHSDFALIHAVNT